MTILFLCRSQTEDNRNEIVDGKTKDFNARLEKEIEIELQVVDLFADFINK